MPPFTPAAVRTLLAACNGGTPVGSRDRALPLTLLDTGIHCAEAVALALADCDFTTRRLHVRHGKSDKARVVPFAARCADALTCGGPKPRGASDCPDSRSTTRES